MLHHFQAARVTGCYALAGVASDHPQFGSASIGRLSAIIVFDGRFQASSVSMLAVRFMNKGSW
ncbi:hypothetical protein [Pseudomonas bohemica]|uniref:hypothetical protein n=1 Tax=Pseudomonas bohemica TaxID=2044872 RepID=UPI0018FE959A|nr:hypothetical protein [Pseudomonas bohemica]